MATTQPPNTCTRSFSLPAPNGERTVTLDCQITDPMTLAYVVEETFPAGWSVTNVGSAPGPTVEGGLNDPPAEDLVTWAVLGGENATLTYTLTPPTPEAAGDFSGLLTAGTGTEFLYAVTDGDTQIGIMPHPADNGFGEGLLGAPCEPEDFVMCAEEALNYGAHWSTEDEEYFPPWLRGPELHFTRASYALAAGTIWSKTDLKRYEDTGDHGLSRTDISYAGARWVFVPDLIP